MPTPDRRAAVILVNRLFHPELSATSQPMRDLACQTLGRAGDPQASPRGFARLKPFVHQAQKAQPRTRAALGHGEINREWFPAARTSRRTGLGEFSRPRRAGEPPGEQVSVWPGTTREPDGPVRTRSQDQKLLGQYAALVGRT